MPMTGEGRWRSGRRRASGPMRTVGGRGRIGAATVLLCALLLAACDGGIFGTGDGPDVGPPIDATPPSISGESSPGSGGSDTGAGDASDVDGETDGATGGTTGGTTGAPPSSGTDPEQPTLVPSSPFENTLVTGTTSTPRVRLVNASGARTTLVDADGEPLLPSALAPAQASAYVNVPLGTDSLRVRRLSGADAADVYRLEPLTLGASSVTTLVVRDTDGADGDVDVVPLRTLTSPDDPAQALVRIVQGARLSASDDAEPATETFTLVPGGASPGGAEVAFENISFDTSPDDIRYDAVPAGDYALSVSNDTMSPLPMSLEGGTVYTLVIIGAVRLLSVVDGAPGAR